MNEIKRIISVKDYADHMSLQLQHPLIGVYDVQTNAEFEYSKCFYGLNVLILNMTSGSPFLYGDDVYHFQNGSVIAFSTGQLIGPSKELRPNAKVVVWHDEIFHGLSVGRMRWDYPFFSYSCNYSLDLNDAERTLVENNMGKIQKILDQKGENANPIQLSRILSQILGSCVAVYKRQYTNYKHEPQGMLSQFEYYLDKFIREKEGYKIGIPEVKYFAEKCKLSSNYFGELFQRLTGMRAKEYIQLRIIEAAKESLVSSSLSTTQVAQSLGFSHPNHFAIYFKNVVGETPNDYRIRTFKKLQRARIECEQVAEDSYLTNQETENMEL